jgi:RND family efflux transporter MFP subunit
MVANWQPTIGAVGTVNGAQQVNIASMVSGKIIQYYVHSGQYVHKGQKLIELNHRVQSAQLVQAKAKAVWSKLQFERRAKLIEKGATTQSDVDQARAEMISDQANVKVLKVEVAQRTIRAPFSGKMGIMPTNLGQYVNPGDDLGTMTQTGSMDINFPVTQQALAHIKVGTPFTFTVDTYPNHIFHSKVTVIDSHIANQTLAIALRGSVKNTIKYPLYSGMLAHINVLLPKLKDQIIVPQTAVVETLYGTSIYVVKIRKGKKKAKTQEHYVKQVFVTVGPSQGDKTVILKGLRPTDMVVVTGQVKIQDGSAVILAHQGAL